MIVRVNYCVEQEVEIADKFNKDTSEMGPDEYDDYIDDLLKEVESKLPDDVSISCIIDDENGSAIFED